VKHSKDFGWSTRWLNFSFSLIEVYVVFLGTRNPKSIPEWEIDSTKRVLLSNIFPPGGNFLVTICHSLVLT